MKRAPRMADLRRGYFRARRRTLQQLIERLDSGVELQRHETLWILRPLKQVLAGRDPREWFGIKSASGPERQHRPRDILITACYLKLRKIEPSVQVWKHLRLLAMFTRLRDSTVRGIVKNRDNVARARRCADGNTAETLENTLRALLSADGSAENSPHVSLFTSED